MANIILKDDYDLKHGYYLIDNSFNKKAGECLESGNYINLKDFKEIVNFITKTNNFVGIINGGSSTHPQIKEILKYVINNNKVERVIFFTNGLYLEKIYNEICNPKISIRITINSYQEIGEEKYNEIIKNLDEIYFNRYNDRFILAINIYKNSIDYQFIIKVLKKYNQNKLRINVVLPNFDKTDNETHFNYLKQLKPAVFNFLKKLKEAEVAPYFDCGNMMIPCICNEEERSFLQDFTENINKKYNYEKNDPRRNMLINIEGLQNCTPIINFTIDKKIVRCFSTPRDERVEMDKFNDLKEIYDYFQNKYDTYSYLIPTDKKCINCNHRLSMRCQGSCLTHKVNKIKECKSLIKRANGDD